VPVHEKNQLFKYSAFCFGQKKLLHNGIISIIFVVKYYYFKNTYVIENVCKNIKKNSLTRTVDRGNIFKYEVIRNNRRQRIKWERRFL